MVKTGKGWPYRAEKFSKKPSLFTPYIFSENDEIGFYLYKKNQYNKEPVISETFIPEAGTDVIEIRISAEDMDIGGFTNVQQEYWYEITLNDEVTLGYDADGPKVLILYPTGKKN